MDNRIRSESTRWRTVDGHRRYARQPVWRACTERQTSRLTRASVRVRACEPNACSPRAVTRCARMLTMMFARRVAARAGVECVSNVARFCQPNGRRPRVRRWRRRRRRRMRIHVLDSAVGHVLLVRSEPVVPYLSIIYPQTRRIYFDQINQTKH